MNTVDLSVSNLCVLSSETPEVCHGDMGRREAQTVKKLLTPHTIRDILGYYGILGDDLNYFMILKQTTENTNIQKLRKSVTITFT
jgi:hypothetical protein